jgi:1,4-alpha-glucan branching enzyme
MKPRKKRLASSFYLSDPYLKPYEAILKRRIDAFAKLERKLTDDKLSFPDFASGHEYFGLHYRQGQWVFREWAPNATAVFWIGTMTDWREKKEYALERINPKDGVWEIRMPEHRLNHQDLYRLRIHWTGGEGERLPAYARRVVQDPGSLIFNAQVWCPPQPYEWRVANFKKSDEPLLIYEVHVGMAQQEERIGTYREFTERILPRIVGSGYDTLQLMAIQEHPYYGSFGYQVSNFFAASSRFGTPEELKALIDAAHEAGLAVIMDLVHSHAVNNEVEGLSRFDGTVYQYFHEGERGRHPAWDSRCFDYGKPEVLHFLLSNCRFWLDEYRLDGFRFDGITSMLYRHHGLGKTFSSYEDYFDDSVDEDALAYLGLANKLIHQIRPDAVTIAEDVSGMPGLAAPISEGGAGFDYRFAMGTPDFWIRLVKDMRDEDWPMGQLWHELTNRRLDEKTISYAESHDQALVGDQTLIFRMIGTDMYDHMQIDDNNINVDRGMALHKMIRLVTLCTAGNGYLNFMGNEFGHPEWIDFPREGNNWTFRYARRLWYLADDANLKYQFLARFDKDLIRLTRKFRLLSHERLRLLYEHNSHKILAFERAGMIFVFNFHHSCSFNDYRFQAPPDHYRMILNTDAEKYGGHGRLKEGQRHFTLPVPRQKGCCQLSLYLPSRSAQVLMPV